MLTTLCLETTVTLSLTLSLTWPETLPIFDGLRSSHAPPLSVLQLVQLFSFPAA